MVTGFPFAFTERKGGGYKCCLLKNDLHVCVAGGRTDSVEALLSDWLSSHVQKHYVTIM